MASVFGSVTGPGFWHAECHVHQQAAALKSLWGLQSCASLQTASVKDVRGFCVPQNRADAILGSSFGCIRKDQLDEHRFDAIYFFLPP